MEKLEKLVSMLDKRMWKRWCTETTKKPKVDVYTNITLNSHKNALKNKIFIASVFVFKENYMGTMYDNYVLTTHGFLHSYII